MDNAEEAASWEAIVAQKATIARRSATFLCPTGRAVGRWIWKVANTCSDAGNLGINTETFRMEEQQTQFPWRRFHPGGSADRTTNSSRRKPRVVIPFTIHRFFVLIVVVLCRMCWSDLLHPYSWRRAVLLTAHGTASQRQRCCTKSGATSRGPLSCRLLF